MSGTTASGIEIQREFQAAPTSVFTAWTTSSSFAHWFGGSDVSVPQEHLDYVAEVGRDWRAQMELPNGSRIDWAGEFVEVTPGARLVLTITDQPDSPARAVITVDLLSSEAGTLMKFTQETPGFDAEQRENVLHGWESFFDAMETLLPR